MPFVDELHAIEIDPFLVDHLRQKFADEPKLTIHHADVLQTDLSQWGPAVVAGNLPYYITSPIVERFLKLGPAFSKGMFLMQYEVAQRLTASSMTRDFGYLTIATQLVASVEIILRVDPRAFNPPPRVESAAVLFTRKEEIPEDVADILIFAGRCMAHKRKTIRNNLRPYYGAQADRQPESFMRAEQLGVPGLIALYRRLRALQPQTTPVSYTESS